VLLSKFFNVLSIYKFIKKKQKRQEEEGLYSVFLCVGGFTKKRIIQEMICRIK